MIDEYYKKDSLVAHNEVAEHCPTVPKEIWKYTNLRLTEFPTDHILSITMLLYTRKEDPHIQSWYNVGDET